MFRVSPVSDKEVQINIAGVWFTIGRTEYTEDAVAYVSTCNQVTEQYISSL